MDSKPEATKFSRLQQEQEKALQGSRELVRKWEEFKYDYDVLQARLHTLPDRLTHDVMVPFGRFGFMQGQLYHTNEVMVLLGDNWFAQRTAKQAIEIAERRKKYVCEMLDKERKVVEDMEARSGFIHELSSAAEQVDKDGFEIREEYNPQEEERRKEAKRKERERRMHGVHIPPPRPAFPKRTTSSLETSGEKRVESEEDMWARLEQRETEEREDTGEEDGGDSVSEESLKKKTTVPTITFRHSKDTSDKYTPLDVSEEMMIFSNPADIYRLPHATDTQEGREEEKGERGVHWDSHLVHYSKQKEVPTAQREDSQIITPSFSHHTQQPFSSIVHEYTHHPAPQQQETTARKVSKFKSSRTTT